MITSVVPGQMGALSLPASYHGIWQTAWRLASINGWISRPTLGASCAEWGSCLPGHRIAPQMQGTAATGLHLRSALTPSGGKTVEVPVPFATLVRPVQ